MLFHSNAFVTLAGHTVSPENKQGSHSGEYTRFPCPPMWPGFDSRTRRHMRVVGSLVCSERFFSLISQARWMAQSRIK